MLLLRSIVVVAVASMLFFLLKTCVAWVDDGAYAALAPAAGLLASLGIMVFGTIAIERRQAQKVAHDEHMASLFSGHSFSAGMRWSSGLGLIGIWLFCLFLWVIWGGRRSGQVINDGVAAPLFALFLLLVISVGYLWRVLQVAKAGYLLSMDMQGLRHVSLPHASLPVVPWSEVRGLHHYKVLKKSRLNEYLAVALTEEAWRRLKPSRWRRTLTWGDMTSAVLVDFKHPVMLIPCDGLSESTSMIVAAALHMADAAGAPRLKSWKYGSDIEQVAQDERDAQERHRLHNADIQESLRALRADMLMLRSSSASAIEQSGLSDRLEQLRSEFEGQEASPSVGLRKEGR